MNGDSAMSYTFRMTPTWFRNNAIALALVVAVTLGSPLHALIPHDHSAGHDHGDHKESIVWQSLHSSLRHEDKKAIPLFDALAIVGVAFFVIRFRIPARSLEVVDSITDALRRGIMPHRKFG